MNQFIAWRSFFLLAVTLIAGLPLKAETSAGRISGVILDSTGAVIPGAKVTARNVETGVEQKAESNGEGAYVLYPLLPGVYEIAAQAAGFRGERLEGVRVDVAVVLKRDIRLEVGMQVEAVVVSAASAPMLTQSVSVESTVSRDQIESIPLNGRDFNDLVLLVPGVVDNTYTGRDFGPLSSNGNGVFSNDYLLDGTPNNHVYQNKSAAAVSVDVIREFKVTSGVAPAEYGQGGTQVTVVTRGGSNRFHGSAFEYHRGTTWQARDVFNQDEPQPFNRNQFGGSLGGPVRRNQTFFFFNYEGNRQSETTTRVATVPIDAFWEGNFSSLLARNIAVRDSISSGRVPFAGNIIPASRIAGIALKMRPYWAPPSEPGLANNLVKTGNSTNTADQFTTRIDHTLPRNQSLTFRYTKAPTSKLAPSILANGSAINQSFANQNTGLGWTLPLGAATVNELRVGYATFRYWIDYQDSGLPTTQSLGMQGFAPLDPVRQPIPRIVFTGNDAFTGLSYGPTPTYTPATIDQQSKTLSLSESLTHVWGKHTIKAGIEYRRLTLPSVLQSTSAGTINFTSTGANSSGYTFGDFLLGLPASTVDSPPMEMIVLRRPEFASYVQDDWRVSRRLTITLGLRHELSPSPYEEKNRLAMFDMETGAIVVASDNGKLPTEEFLPSIVSRLSDGRGQWRFPLLSDKEAGRNPRTLIDRQYRFFGPRAGFVYQVGPSSDFVVRGGYGIFYTRYPIQHLEQTIQAVPPFAATFNYTQAIANGVPALTLQSPYGSAATSSIAPSGLQRDFKLPNNQQWNLTLERHLGSGTVLSLGYVGNKGTHLFKSANANGPYLDPVTRKVVRKYASTYGNVAINVRQTIGNSIYNAMQTEFRRRTRKGLLFQASWTWAKGLDNLGGAINNNALDVENLGRDRADSDGVRRHLIKFNGAYDLPFGRGRAFAGSAPRWLDAVIGGWRLSGMSTYTTGMHFTPTFTATGGLSNNRPDVVYGVKANLPRSERRPSRWFNAAAFAPVPAIDPAMGTPRFGNAGRNILIGPGINTVDASMVKSFSVFGEGRRLTFRVELFNAFNHPNYSYPEANISNVNTVATINVTVRPMRQAQFAMRFDF